MYTTFERMPVWKKGMDLAEQVFTITERLAETKNHLIYGLRVGYFQQSEFNGLEKLVETIWKELNKLISSFRPQPST